MRKITINISNKDYELWLNRDNIKWLERNGYVYENSYNMPITYYDLLWTVGFINNYSNLSPDEVLELRDKYREEGGDPSEVTKFMTDEYLSFINALADTKSVTKKAKITEV
nr:MAG TPA: protein of unknown function (DUF5055) [Caudoviricetes sp.]